MVSVRDLHNLKSCGRIGCVIEICRNVRRRLSSICTICESLNLIVSGGFEYFMFNMYKFAIDVVWWDGFLVYVYFTKDSFEIRIVSREFVILMCEFSGDLVEKTIRILIVTVTIDKFIHCYFVRTMINFNVFDMELLILKVSQDNKLCTQFVNE